jgi:hypothetical protein
LFHQLASNLWISSFDKSDKTTCSKLMNASMLMQVEKSGLLKVVQAICSKLVDNKSDKTTCSNSVKIRFVAT